MEKPRDILFYEPKNGYDRLKADERIALEDYCAGYMRFLDEARTEREAVRLAVREAEAAGFRPFDPAAALEPGDRVYRVNRGKALMLAVIGREPLSAGAFIAAAHIDSPRLDLKQIPLYEDGILTGFFSPKGITKKPTGRVIQYSKEKNALAGPYWFERAKADHKNKWLTTVKKAVKNG